MAAVNHGSKYNDRSRQGHGRLKCRLFICRSDHEDITYHRDDHDDLMIMMKLTSITTTGQGHVHFFCPYVGENEIFNMSIKTLVMLRMNDGELPRDWAL